MTGGTQLSIAAQPVRAAASRLVDRHIIGREVLARPRRWPTSARGWKELDRAVVQEINRQGLPGPIFLNVSGATLLSDSSWSGFLGGLARVPGPLVVEMPENMCCTSRIRPRIADLRAIGAWVAIDDFGSGHSTLQRVEQLDLDIMKIDYRPGNRTQVHEYDPYAARDEAARRGMLVIVEGVEEEADIVAAKDIGATAIQGFGVGMPELINADTGVANVG